MTRLIDADAIVEFARERDKKTMAEGTRMLLTFLRNMVELQPTVDAVPVIRCKDCKWYEFDKQHRCGYVGCTGYIKEDDYCSKAEPKVTE